MFGLENKEISPSDWVAGEFTPINNRDMLPSGDWSNYLPIVETQNRWGYDRMACVTYSFLNCLETKQYFLTGKLVNYSDRDLARLSGTQKWGNSLATVFDTARKQGLVLESSWPDTEGGWDIYYDSPAGEQAEKLKEERQNWVNTWGIYREWIRTDDRDAIYKALKQSPLQVTVKFANGYDLNPKASPDHAVMVYNAEYGKRWWIFDHYTQSKKSYAWDYEFGCVLKPTLIKKDMQNFTPDDNALYLLVEGSEQILSMGYKGALMIYDEKIDTLLNSVARTKKYQIPTPINLSQYNSVKHINGKGEEL